jgi:high-affinity Fe2+/Pb2+ permease
VSATSRNAGLAVAAAALIALAPGAAEACAVCFSGREEGRAAYLATTLLMTLLPLGLIGGLVWWLRRRAAELRADAEARRSRAA